MAHVRGQSLHQARHACLEAVHASAVGDSDAVAASIAASVIIIITLIISLTPTLCAAAGGGDRNKFLHGHECRC